MDIVTQTIEQIGVLVTLAFVIAQAHLITPTGAREATVVRRLATFGLFLTMALTEGLVARQSTPMSARIVSACAAGLLGGPWVGGAVGLSAALLRQALGITPPVAFGVAMVTGGVAGGLVRLARPDWALRTWAGLLLGAAATLLRYAVTLGLGRIFHTAGPPLPLAMETVTAVINGLGVALILKVVEQVQSLEESSRAAAMAEVRALQSRMSPHFLFNALNTIAALSAVAPQSIPSAVAKLGRFLRGSLELHERPTVPLRQELEIVTAYLDIEALRFGDRLRVETDVAPELAGVAVPPFPLQPLVENAVRHGIQPRPEGGVAPAVRTTDPSVDRPGSIPLRIVGCRPRGGP